MTDLPPRLRRMLAPWSQEPDPIDESSFTVTAPEGWSAWNAFSPELEVCETAAQLVRLVRPSTVIETGVGQGYLTRRAVAALPEGSTYTCFESDDRLRPALRELSFVADHPGLTVSDHATPDAALLATADLTILDSGPDHRSTELLLWREVARAGAFLLVHDTGHGHPEWTPHHRLRMRIEEMGIPGVFLSNPRGSFLGQQR